MTTETSKKQNVLYWEDHSSRKLKESKVGRKALSLFKLKDMDVPVPEFFSITGKVFSDFCTKALDGNSEKLLEKGRNPEEEEIESTFLRTDFTKDIEEEILTCYTRLSGFTDAWVSVRSSVIFPENEEVSFTGIFSTELNVRGFDDLKKSIKRIYSSLFDDDVVVYAAKMGIDLSDVKLGVVVQKMVQSEVSGVVFTVDPITQDRTKLSIEAVYGLGDVIALGEITPDTYLLNKRDLSVVEKHIAPQEWMRVRTMRKSTKKKSNVEKIKISQSWSHRQKLNDKDMQEISKVALIVENKSGKAQNIEWVVSGGRLWILQNKELYSTTAKTRLAYEMDGNVARTLRDVVKGFVDKYNSTVALESQVMSQAKKIVEKNKKESGLQKLINSAKQATEKKGNNVEIKQEDFLVSGIGASFGVARGKVVIVDGSVNRRVGKENILLIKKFSSELESAIMSSGGVVMDTGGITSDTAILCRECGIPAVLGTKDATTLLKDGDNVYIDGNTGSIYKDGRMSEQFDSSNEIHPVVEAYKDENLSGIDLMQQEAEKEVKKEEEVVEEVVNEIPRDTTLSPTATKVYSMTDLEPKKMFEFVGNSHGIVYVDLDKILLEDGRHIMAYVEDKKFVDFSKKMCEKIVEYVELAQGNEVIVSLGSATVEEFRGLTKGKSFEDADLSDFTYGAAHYISNKEMLKRVIKIVKRVRNVYKKRNVSIAIHSPMGVDMMKEFKKQLSGEKLRRTSSFNVYAVLDNPAEVIMADEILGTNIDGLILNMPRIARQMQGFKMNDPKAKYDLSRNSIFKIVDNVVDVVKPLDKRVIVVAEDSTDLVKHSVQAGVYGVSVDAENIVDARRLVSEQESKLILGR